MILYCTECSERRIKLNVEGNEKVYCYETTVVILISDVSTLHFAFVTSKQCTNSHTIFLENYRAQFSIFLHGELNSQQIIVIQLRTLVDYVKYIL